jgi:2-polyprenyl-6-methoxyphenol hydroxylase-like FAD-dependent oxidoreductase
MVDRIETGVLIVGAGPVGLTLAMDLAWRGIDVTVAEKRERGEPPEVKCNHVAARSMEIFRRLGIVERVRNAGLPADYPNDVAYRTTTTGLELARILIPARNQRYSATGGPDTWWPTPEPPHRINQIFLEPVLVDSAAAMANIRLINRVEVTGFTQGDGHVTASARHLGSGAALSIHAAYMVGCDGGRSGVRKAIGSKLEGDAVIQRVQSTYFRAPALIHMLRSPPAWGTFSLNPRRSGNVYAIDGRETWLLHNYLRDDEPDFDSVDRDWSIRQILGVGDDFTYEIISNEDWYGRRLVVDKLCEGRVFICGDAAHLWVPYAGYGMNAGIADAENLAWMLAARMNGWAPASILTAHEAERLPITEQVSRFAMDHAHAMASQRRAVPERIEEDSAEGRRLRAEVGRAAYDLNVQQYCAGGLNFGYYYDASPIIAYDTGRQPGYTMADFTPSTVPGCRTPHIWLPDGTSLYDYLGRDFTLLRFDPAVDAAPLIAAAARAGVPLKVFDVPAGAEAAAIYRENLVLSRPDRHVAWRGDASPVDPAALIDHVRGASHRAVLA